MTTFDSPVHALPAAERQLPPGHSPYSESHPRKHGFVPELALSNEERDSFFSLEARLYDEYRPTCATESLLLDEVTLNYWRLQRARALESETLAHDRENQKLLALYYRYRLSFERSFYHALRLLRKVKAENTKLIAQFAAGPNTRLTLRSSRFVSQNRFGQPTIDAPAERRPLDEEAA